MFLKIGGAYINLGAVRDVALERWNGAVGVRLIFLDGAQARYSGATGDRVIAAIEALCIDDPTPPPPPIPMQQRMSNKKGHGG